MSPGRRAPATLALGSVVSGLLAYVLFASLTRGLGAEAAAPVSVLWTQWSFAGAAFTFPLQHWITRGIAAGHEGDLREAAPRVALLVVAVAVGLGALAWLARDPLFHRDDAWFPVLVALMTVGTAVLGVVRGGLGGRGRFEAVAWSLVAENALRCVLVGALLLAGVRSPVAHGLSLVAGSLVAGLWPAALRLTGTPTGQARALTFLGGAATAQLIGQTVLTGAPVVLALLGGAPREVTAMFAALALFRAPYLVAVGSMPQLTLRIARATSVPDRARVRTLARAVSGLSLVTAAVAAAAGAWLGPGVLRLVYGASIDVSPGQAALLVAGSTLAVANLVLTVLAVAQDRPGAAAGAWGAAVVLGAFALATFSGLAPVRAASAGFVAVEVAAALALLVVSQRAPRRSPLSRA